MNAAGETVYGCTAVCGTRYLFYSAADISSGESYSIGSMTATAQTGTATTGMGGSPGGTGGKTDGRMGGPGGGQRPDDGDREPPEMGDSTELPERPEQPE